VTTSGTTTFNPANADLVLDALSRIAIRGPAVSTEHLFEARMSANLILADWSGNRSVNLWAVDLQTVPCVVGEPNYPPPPDTVNVLDAYITNVPGGSTRPQDLTIRPVGRSEYAALPDKTRQGRPTVYWFQRTNPPKLTLWEVPNDTYTLNYYRMRVLQDFNILADENLDTLARFCRAFSTELAQDLYIKFPPPQDRGISFQVIQQEAMRHWASAAGKDVENVPQKIYPNFWPYYR
jgi:hypothetical protein